MRALCAVLLTGLLFSCGCGGGEFPTAATSGVVMCDGAPVAHAMVFLEPVATGNSALVGKQGLATTDANGRFVISTYGDGDGAVVGEHRVRVGPPNPDQHAAFSCNCELNPEVDVQQVKVAKGSKNEFEIVLRKATTKRKPTLDELEAIEDAAEEARRAKPQTP